MKQKPPSSQEPKALVESIVKEAFEDVLLTESVKEGVKHKIGNREMEFGSPDHVRVLRGMLHGLQGLRDCYQMGSANRHVYSAACHKLRKLIAKHSPG